MSQHGMIDHFVPLQKFVQPLPKLDILHRFGASRGLQPPAILFPSRHPLAEPLPDIRTVGHQFHSTSPLQRLQTPNDGGQFHAIIRRHRLGPRFLSLLARLHMTEHERPSTRARVSTTSTIRVQLHQGRALCTRGGRVCLGGGTRFLVHVISYRQRPNVQAGPRKRLSLVKRGTVPVGERDIPLWAFVPPPTRWKDYPVPREGRRGMYSPSPIRSRNRSLPPEVCTIP